MLLLWPSNGPGQTKVCDFTPTSAVDEYVTGLEIPMNDVARVHVENCVQQLIHDVTLVQVLQDVSAFDCIVQITLHVLKGQVDVHVIRCSVHTVELHDVRMAAKGAQEHDFTEGALGIGLITERVKNLFHGHRFVGTSVNGPPNNSICTTTQTLCSNNDDDGKHL